MLGTLFLPMVAFLQPSHPTGRGSLAEAMVARSSCHLSPTCRKRDRKEKYGDCYFVLKTSVVAPVHLSHSLNTEPEICLLLREIRKVNRVPLAKYREKKITATSGLPRQVKCVKWHRKHMLRVRWSQPHRFPPPASAGCQSPWPPTEAACLVVKVDEARLFSLSILRGRLCLLWKSR